MRTAEWGWLGWLPHLRPVHGQDCRLLTAYDRDQAAARTAELLRRLDRGTGLAARLHARSRMRRAPCGALVRARSRCSSWTATRAPPSLRETVSRLAAEGPQAGIHLLCLAETPRRDSLLTAVGDGRGRVLHVARLPRVPRARAAQRGRRDSRTGRAAGGRRTGPAAGPWRRGARSVRSAPSPPSTRSRPHGPSASHGPWRPCVNRKAPPRVRAQQRVPASRCRVRPGCSTSWGLPGPRPAALLARWAEPEELSASRATLVFGAGPRGPLEAELTLSRGHALVMGPSGSGKTELLRSLAASLAAGARPDRLRLVLLDGDGAAGTRRPAAPASNCRTRGTTWPPATRWSMREFAQSLSGELKRRAELLGGEGTYAVSSRRARAVPATASSRRATPATASARAGARQRAPSRRAAHRPRTGYGSMRGPGAVHGTLRLRTAQFQSRDAASGCPRGRRPGPRRARRPAPRPAPSFITWTHRAPPSPAWSSSSTTSTPSSTPPWATPAARRRFGRARPGGRRPGRGAARDARRRGERSPRPHGRDRRRSGGGAARRVGMRGRGHRR